MLLRVDDLRGWADTDMGVNNLPYWVGRLIDGTCTDITISSFPAGKKARYWPDTDGVLECGGGPEFIPRGLSVWEMGQVENVRGKAEDDFTKRSAEDTPRGYRHDQLHFVFITAYDWAGAEVWLQEKRRLNAQQPPERQWRGIHVITAQRLTRWLHMAPWLGFEFMREELNRDVSGLATVEMEFKAYQHVPGAELPPSFVICNRRAPRDRLIEWLEKPVSAREQPLFLAADTPMEGRHFVAASIVEFGQGEWLPLLSRAIFVDKEPALWALRQLNETHVLVVSDPALHSSAVSHIKQFNCKLILIQPLAATQGTTTVLGVSRILLEQAALTDVFEELLRLGVDEVGAREIVAQSRGRYSLIRDALTAL